MFRFWEVCVLMCYGALLLALVFPVFFGAPEFPGVGSDDLWAALLDGYEWPGTWMIWAALLVCQAVLLFVPVNGSGRQERVRPRRGLGLVIVVTALFAAILLYATYLSVSFTFLGDETFEVWEDFFGEDWTVFTALLLGLFFLWGFWAWVFYQLTQNREADEARASVLKWLFRGSMAELLVAVPCHIWVRNKEECCAPYGTALGLAAGLAVMFASFGPGVIILFRDKIRQKRGGAKDARND